MTGPGMMGPADVPRDDGARRKNGTRSAGADNDPCHSGRSATIVGLMLQSTATSVDDRISLGIVPVVTAPQAHAVEPGSDTPSTIDRAA